MTYRPEYDLKVIGQNLKRLRSAKHLSVDYVREYLRLGSVQAVYKYENGKSYPQADTMFALMELYGASLHDIVGKHEEDDKSSSVIGGAIPRRTVSATRKLQTRFLECCRDAWLMDE